MTPEQFEALEEVIEEVELARIEQETAPQRVRLQRARDLLDEFLKASEEVNVAPDDTATELITNCESLGASLNQLVTVAVRLTILRHGFSCRGGKRR
jgi:hypothetical protein